MSTTLLLPWLAALVAGPALGATIARRCTSGRRARAAGLAVAGPCLLVAALLLAAGGAGVVTDPWGWPTEAGARPLLGLDPLGRAGAVVVAAVACAAVAAAPPRAAVIARLLWLEAGGLLALAGLHPTLVVGGWALTLGVAAREAAAAPGGRPGARVVLAYQGAALAALAVHLAAAHLRGASGAPPGPLELGALVVAVAGRQALAPLHSWALALVEGGPGAAATFLGAQLGTAALLRAIDADGPGLAPALAALGALSVATALLGALLGLAQRSPRRALGCLLLSQGALIPAGVTLAHGPAAHAGVVLAWLGHGLAGAGLLLGLDAIERRLGPLDLARYAGLSARMPRLGALFLVLGLALVALPGSAAFCGEDLLIGGMIEAHPFASAALVVAAATNGYTVLRLALRLFWGPDRALPPVGDLLGLERAALTGLVVAALAAGLLAQPLVRAAGVDAAPASTRPPEGAPRPHGSGP